MTTINREAALLMRECHASAATDVTGFGLIGHASEMALGAGVTIRLELDTIPTMAGVAGLVADGMVPAGCYRNRDYYLPRCTCSGIDNERLLPLFDPQTSGGLLIAMAPADARRFLAESANRGIFSMQIGEVLPRQSQPILLS